MHKRAATKKRGRKQRCNLRWKRAPTFMRRKSSRQRKTSTARLSRSKKQGTCQMRLQPANRRQRLLMMPLRLGRRPRPRLTVLLRRRLLKKRKLFREQKHRRPLRKQPRRGLPKNVLLQNGKRRLQNLQAKKLWRAPLFPALATEWRGRTVHNSMMITPKIMCGQKSSSLQHKRTSLPAIMLMLPMRRTRSATTLMLGIAQK